MATFFERTGMTHGQHLENLAEQGLGYWDDGEWHPLGRVAPMTESNGHKPLEAAQLVVGAAVEGLRKIVSG